MQQRLFLLIKRIIKFFTVRPYYLLRDQWFIWHLLNRGSRKRFERNKPVLDPVQQRIVDDFRRDGIAITTIDELFPGEELLQRFQEYLARHKHEARVVERKSFYIDLWDSGKSLLTAENPFMSAMLHPRILDIVNSYMGMWMRLSGVRVVGTEVATGGADPRQSQLWHRDPEDKKSVKFFLYLNDVDEGTGPFMYARGSHAEGKWYHVAPRLPKYNPRRGRVPDVLVEKEIPREQIHVCTGPAGTLVFADTIGLHRGGYSTEKPRWMFSPSYKTNASVSHRKKFTYPGDFDEQMASLYPPARYAAARRFFYVP